jgi:TolB-like protein/Flp pilus assembly protein TadD
MKKLPQLSLSELQHELKRRKVYPVVAAYAVIAWILLQVGEVTFEPLGLPGWVMTALVVTVIAGFPVVVVLSWVFDIKATPPQTQRQSRADSHLSDDLPSIAVLPFVDMSPDKDQGYFCDGVAEEILNALSRIRRLHVLARTSSFQYREGTGDVREIGDQLGVQAILEGSVRKQDNRLRVTVQLVKVADGYHLWSKSFDEGIEDIFAIQDEIATGVVRTMLDTLEPVTTTSSQHVDAYDFYLRGRQFFNRLNKMDIEFALQMFHKAIDIDPEFAQAWAGYADCHSFLMMYVDHDPGNRAIASEASKRALELDPDLAEAHASRGLAHLICEEFEKADAAFETALELNPGLFEAYYYYGRSRFHQGDMEMAVDLFAKAARVNPDDYQSRLLRVQILRGMGRLDDATEEARQSVAAVERHLEWNPDDARALHLGAGSLILTGDTERAKRWLQRALEIDPNDSVVLYNVACNYATLGEVDEALDYLQQAIEHGTVSLSWMQNDADLDNLREEPRFAAMLRDLERQS